jgi:hypothetical protein
MHVSRCDIGIRYRLISPSNRVIRCSIFECQRKQQLWVNASARPLKTGAGSRSPRARRGSARLLVNPPAPTLLPQRSRPRRTLSLLLLTKLGEPSSRPLPCAVGFGVRQAPVADESLSCDRNPAAPHVDETPQSAHVRAAASARLPAETRLRGDEPTRALAVAVGGSRLTSSDGGSGS